MFECLDLPCLRVPFRRKFPTSKKHQPKSNSSFPCLRDFLETLTNSLSFSPFLRAPLFPLHCILGDPLCKSASVNSAQLKNTKTNETMEPSYGNSDS